MAEGWTEELLAQKLRENPHLKVAVSPPNTTESKSRGIKPILGRSWHKYHAERTEYNGVKYPSKKEARVAKTLDLMKVAGSFDFYLRQVSFPLSGGLIYRADFVTFAKMQNQIVWRIKVIEVKGFKTPVWIMKRKLFKEAYPNLEMEVIQCGIHRDENVKTLEAMR